jgi:hypothetical protein
METAGARHAFDRLDPAPLALEAEHQAGEHRLSVHEHGAGAALSELASVLGAGEIQVLAEDFEKGLVGSEGGFDGFAVQGEADVRPGEIGLSRLARSSHNSRTLIPLF